MYYTKLKYVTYYMPKHLHLNSIQAHRKKCLSTQITCLFSNMCKIDKTKQLMNFKICLIKDNIQKKNWHLPV